MSLLSCAQIGSSLALRTYGRLGSSLSILDFASCGSSLSIRQLVRIGSYLNLVTNVFADSSTLTGDATGFVASVGTEGKVTWNSDPGGVLHGVWHADNVISTSDRRLKDNVRPLRDALHSNFATAKGGSPVRGEDPTEWMLRQIRPVSYHFKSDTIARDERFGFIADELEQVMPQAVQTGPSPEKRQSVMYQDLIAVLISMMQDLGGSLAGMAPRVMAVEERIRKRRAKKRRQRRQARTK